MSDKESNQLTLLLNMTVPVPGTKFTSRLSIL